MTTEFALTLIIYLTAYRCVSTAFFINSASFIYLTAHGQVPTNNFFSKIPLPYEFVF